ncbi:flagellin [Paenibacillus eucommiae]|uniref:Flagellin n=1 Tax=Paenibacillus eucommiae TaxID=1355755 RepID=A0ABS4IYH8_9BACL|nr:flagellin [Paenibacillus eucommiae]MBP1992645.1 flagellin [Paenibacillus eucommiae]
MRINHNIGALNTYRQLTANTEKGAKSIEKLSSGLRINRAGDDAAGLAISEKMRAQIRGLDQATRNSQDGISMIQTTEGALNETHSILQRMRELANQSASDTNVGVDRAEIQKEMNQLTSEINRIGNTTEFNTQALLKGKTGTVTATDSASKTITDGVAGVLQGELSGLTTVNGSVVGSTSTTTIQASSSKATGAFEDVTETTASVKGIKATVGVSNGITFEADAVGTGLNGKTITIKQSATGTAQTSGLTIDGSGNYTFTIGEDAAGTSLATDRATYYNQLKSAIDDFSINGNAGAGFALGEAITVKPPASADSPLTAFNNTVATIGGGVNEVAGVYDLKLDKKFTEAGDTVKIAGKTFTAVIGTADPSKGEFQLATTSALVGASTEITQATSLLAAIQADADISARFTIDNAGGTLATLTFTEKAGQATGVALSNTTVAGSGSDDKLVIKNGNGNNLRNVSIDVATNVTASGGTVKLESTAGNTLTFTTTAADGAKANGVRVVMEAGTGTDPTAVYKDGKLTISLGTDATQNIGTNILAEVKAIGVKDGIDFNGWTQVSAGNFGNATGVSATAAHINADQMVAGGKDTQVASTMSVEFSNGDIKIHLANDNASENTAAKIQAALKALVTAGEVGGYWEAGQHKVVDLNKFTFEAQGNWDTKTLGNSITKATGTFTGGVEDVKGKYTFDVTKAFGEGDQVLIKGEVFTAVSGLADATKGQFSINANGLGTGTLNEQTTSLLDAISLNSKLSGYEASIVSGTTNKIQLVEKASSGKDLKATDLDTKATGTLGEFSISSAPLNNDGGSFVIDGVEIKISNKEANVGYANGTVIKEASTVLEQNKALVDAINKNTELKGKYTASINEDGDMNLVQTNGSATGPQVQAKTSPKGDFTATFQVGANSGQSMTIEVGDMRANALNISGDGSVSNVQAKNGIVASFVAVANVGDGSTKNLTEFALDVSTSEKASAAISVINDAIEVVSGQRSQLGAYQNRLEHTINNLGTSSENLTAAESRIRDVDMAKEIMENTKNNILAQAAQAMLAQANQSTQGVLQLLR